MRTLVPTNFYGTVRSVPRLFAFAVALLSTVSCGGDGGTEPQVVGSISITPASPSGIPAGTTLQLSATVLSTKGETMSGQVLSFATSAPGIATVSNNGLVTSVGPVGSAEITGSVGSIHRSVTVNVIAGPAASLTRTSPDPVGVGPGASVGDSVRYVVKDAFGNPRPQQTVSFAVAEGGGQVSPASAQTDAQGRAATVFITGTIAGTNTLHASITGIAPVPMSLTTVAGSVTITSISPSPMIPGTAATIVGTGFSPTATSDAVSIDGIAATVTTASATELVVAVPTALPCTPTHQATVQVTANGASAVGHQALRVGTIRALAVGSSVVLSDPADINCTELSPGNGHYAVNVVNTSAAPVGLSPFHFAGATSIPPGTTFARNPSFTLRQSFSRAVRSPQISTDARLPSIRSAAHLIELESNRLLYQELKKSFSAASKGSPAGRTARASMSAAVPVLGDIRSFRVLQPSTAVGATGGCSNFVEISAKVVYVGTKTIIFEDVAAPLAGQMDSHFIRLGQEFDTAMYPTEATYFGDPLVTDAFTDNDQHLSMVFTPSIPSALGGFVTGCDFAPRNTTNRQASNLGEIFYAVVPKVAATGFGQDTPDSWLRAMRGIVVHEVKHIASFGAHLVNNAFSFEESWLEEGMAMTAEEVWARDRIYAGASWKGNMVYATTLFCDVRPTNPACTGAPFVVFDHFARLYQTLDLPGTTSLFGRVADNDFAFYTASWSFIRFNADRYATSEVDFLRGITQATDVTGLNNVARRTGANTNDMLGNWTLSLTLDENPAIAGNPDANFPSWNLRDIYAGMNRDFATNFPKLYPLVPQTVPAGDFTIDNQGIHGGSFSPFDLIGVNANTRTIGVSGSPLFRLVVARVQ